MLKKLFQHKFFTKYFHILVLVGVCFLVLAVNLQINIFRYNNFDLGKFDLGNMTQMVWNTLHGRVLYLTDYFGTNLPRWSMSHVDPILLLFVPVFAIFQSPLTLVISQLILVIFSAFLVYYISLDELKSKTSSLFLAVSYLVFPAVGFITAWTAFHGVTVAIPFFLGAFYIYKKMERTGVFSGRLALVFWIMVVVCMSGKEQISLYFVVWGLVICAQRIFHVGVKNFKSDKGFKLGAVLASVSLIWFCLAFFVIIPHYSKYRIEGFQRFAESLNIDPTVVTDVSKPNYFLKRYDEFGSTYSEVILNIVFNPLKALRVFLGGDKLENFNMTFAPVLYIPFLHPTSLIIALPDLAINYLTTLDGVGTSEIYNHRVSMIIPVIFVSVIFGISFVSRFVLSFFPKTKLRSHYLYIGLSLILLLSNFKFSNDFENPAYMWFTQAVQKRLVGLVFAKTNEEILEVSDLKPGYIARLSRLDSKDRECAQKVIKMIPSGVSVSGPDYLGAHLSMRETYAIFPALHNTADYVIVDVFSKKIVTILDIDVSFIRDVTQDVLKNPNYELTLSCGNLFVFKNVGPHGKANVLPLQERLEYKEVVDYPIFGELNIVDYQVSDEVTRRVKDKATIVYARRGSTSLNDFILYTTMINKKTGEVYEFANLPSFSLMQLREWESGSYYIEELDIIIPEYLDAGTYMFFVGMTNNVRTRNVYIKDIRVY